MLPVGISAHQKLDLLSGLVTLLGFEGLSVFGDCFDEVTLLDPVRFPGGRIKNKMLLDFFHIMCHASFYRGYEGLRPGSVPQ